MIAVIVKIKIKPGRMDEAVAALLDNARGAARDEPGCLQYNVAREAGDDHCLRLYELYRDEDALEAHRQSPHFLRWREVAADFLDGEPELVTGAHLFP